MEGKSNVLFFRPRDPEKEAMKLREKIVREGLIKANAMLCNFNPQAAHECIKKTLEDLRRSEVPHVLD